MTDVPTAYLSHELAHRCRIRVAQRRGDDVYFSDAAHTLAAFDGVEEVLANPATASLLITHDTTTEAIIEKALQARLFTLSKQTQHLDQPPPPPATLTMADLAELNTKVLGLSGGKADLGTVVASMLAIVALFQMVNGKIAVPAIAALWYALGTLALGKQLSDGSFEIKKHNAIQE